MESGGIMLVHSFIIGLLLYLFMVYVLGQKQTIAENRSILMGSIILIYMILFGHGLPRTINKDL